MTSLRARLFGILVATTGVIWLAAAAWIYFGTKAELQRVLDTRLQEAARMVSSLIREGDASAASAIGAAPQFTAPAEGYERQLSCQVWSLGGRLVAASSSAPAAHLSDRGSGFSNSVVAGEVWRVYAIEDADKGVRVLVGDRLGLRDRLVQDLVLGLVAPTLLILPLFACMIWLSLGRGLTPLRHVASDLQSRRAEDLAPVDTEPVDEIRPLTDALNGLFARLDAARRHERDFTAFAAHELRTPLAGIRTQAQIAQAAETVEMRQSALAKIVQGVDRTARLVSQLLALTGLDAARTAQEARPMAIGALLREIDRGRPRADLHVHIDPALDDVICDHPDTMRLALRNLHENACAYSPPRGAIVWLRTGAASFGVEDEGPGIVASELPLVTQRFYRGSGSRSTGSGLGLAIVEAALSRLGGRLTLEARGADGGLRATITSSDGASDTTACPPERRSTARRHDDFDCRWIWRVARRARRLLP